MKSLPIIALFGALQVATAAPTYVVESARFEVIDGDSLRAPGYPDIHLLGIDAPESAQRCTETTENRKKVRCGADSTAYLLFRAARWESSASNEVPDANCPIKGNINSKGVKIYHMPHGRDYKRTRISMKKGERWFCNEAEATGSGWRAARYR